MDEKLYLEFSEGIYDEVTDDELISYMRESFDGVCQGSLEHLGYQRDNKKRIYKVAGKQEKSRKRLCLRDFFLFKRKYKTVQKHMKKSV